MKLSKSHLQQIIKEELQSMYERSDDEGLDDIMLQQLEKSSPHMARNFGTIYQVANRSGARNS